jgi:hypothetical protein
MAAARGRRDRFEARLDAPAAVAREAVPRRLCVALLERELKRAKGFDRGVPPLALAAGRDEHHHRDEPQTHDRLSF